MPGLISEASIPNVLETNKALSLINSISSLDLIKLIIKNLHMHFYSRFHLRFCKYLFQ